MSENSVLNLSCPICKLVFKNSDSIYSTSCGHIFHFACLSSWKTQSTSCPQCRDYNPSSHRIYLNFDEAKSGSQQIQADYEVKIKTLEKEVEDKRIQYQQLRLESDKFRKMTEQRIKKLSDIAIQLEAEKQTLAKSLKDANEKTASETQKTMKLTDENKELKGDLASKDTEATETKLRYKVKVLEQKLQHLTTELEREISKNTELSIEKMKLQSFVSHMNTNTSSPDLYSPQKPKKVNKPKPKTAMCPMKSIVISKLPLEKLELPLENIIITLAQKMNCFFKRQDIKRVINKTAGSNTAEAAKEFTFWVEFKSEAAKQLFVLNKDLLQIRPEYCRVEIEEYKSENLGSLFTYANKNLRGSVFNYIAKKPNAVVAKKNLCDSQEIVIESQSHVDELLKSM